MKQIPVFFAQYDLDDVVVYWEKMNDATRDVIIVFGSLFVVSLFVVVWAVFVRRSRRRRARRQSHGHSHAHSQAQAQASVPAETGEGADASQRRRRRRRREHRPRNPTLAETGGLPPMRAEPPPD
jgi:hypothetical protein